jgi:hypothetical protein
VAASVLRLDVSDMCSDRPVPPVMVVHGRNDTLVPIQDSRRFWRALQRRRQRDERASAEAALRRAVAASTVATEAAGTPIAYAAPLVSDVFVELPRAHHAFNFIVSARTLAMGDAVADWIEELRKRHIAAASAAASAERSTPTHMKSVTVAALSMHRARL